MNIIEIFEKFPTQDHAREYIKNIRWPQGVECPKCSCKKISELKSRKQYTCLNCRYRFSVTSDTVMHSTKLDLRKWLCAICLLVNAKKSVSSHQLGRDLNISVKRAWHLNHRIREAMREDHSQAELFRGVCQIDDYYFGGRPRPEEKYKIKRGRGSQKKQPIVGVIENKTRRVRTAVVPNTKGKTMVKTVGPWLDKKKVELHSDEHLGYNKLGHLCGPHKTVNHSEWYVAKDGTNTNAVENAWSLFARAVMGSFHHISRKHLHRYLSEFDSRFNAREIDTTKYTESILSQANGRRLTMNQLTNKTA